MKRRWAPILALTAMGLLGYIRRLRAKQEVWMHQDDHNKNGCGPDRDIRSEDDARLEEQLREDVRRYEQDLRELAKH